MTLDTALLIIYAEGSVMVIMLGIIGYFIVATARMANKRMDNQDNRMDKMIDFMEAQQDEIKNLSSQMKSTIDLVRVNQDKDSKRMDFIERILTGKLKVAKA